MTKNIQSVHLVSYAIVFARQKTMDLPSLPLTVKDGLLGRF